LFGPSYARIRAARAAAQDCWRAGLASASIFDEALAPEATLRAMNDLSADLALIVGPDWCLLDPALSDAVIDRAAPLDSSHPPASNPRPTSPSPRPPPAPPGAPSTAPSSPTSCASAPAPLPSPPSAASLATSPAPPPSTPSARRPAPPSTPPSATPRSASSLI